MISLITDINDRKYVLSCNEFHMQQTETEMAPERIALFRVTVLREREMIKTMRSMRKPFISDEKS